MTASPSSTANTTVAIETPLEDLMVAMDVVDTLRHQEHLVLSELKSENRSERLIKKLKDIYQAQGIQVTEDMLTEGVKALEEDRYAYDAPQTTLQTRLATLYVKRQKWLPQLLTVLIMSAALSVFYFIFIANPRAKILAELPQMVESTYQSIQSSTQEPAALAQSEFLKQQATEAINNKNRKQSRYYSEQLSALQSQLQSTYRIRIINRPDQRSGIWRTPPNNPLVNNFYLIVEAIDPSGKRVPVKITNEENNKIEQVNQWGLRVPVAEFNKVKQDKSDDGIIQNNIIGEKPKGMMTPNYDITTSGATISSW